jgi:hypothetical protein
MIGLAIDGANVYMMRNQINTALDAAVLAGNRSLNLNQGVVSQTCDAMTQTCTGAAGVAQQTFMADITGNMSMATLQFTSNQDPTTHIISVTGAVNASIPLMMMGMVGVTSTNINLSATSQRRAVNIVMVLDHSAPMQNTIGSLTTAASAFVGTFVNGSDNIGLIGFTAAPYSPPADQLVAGTHTSLPQVQTDINNLTVPSTYSVTNPSAAIWAAYQQLKGMGQPGALNVIVLFIGTVPNAYTANFAGLLTSTTYCSPLSASPLYGVIWANPYSAGTGGLADYTSASLDDTPESRGAQPYCTTDTNGPGAFLSSMPAWAGLNNDYSTNGSDLNNPNGAYAPVNLSAFNKVSVTAASKNALDDAAYQIRSDTTYAPVIFTIAFNSNLVAAPDSVLMARIANDPTSAYYNSGQPAGQYIYAPSAQAIETAFSGISSKVLQLAK